MVNITGALKEQILVQAYQSLRLQGVASRQTEFVSQLDNIQNNDFINEVD